jgi:hypothetical protein
MSGRKALAQVRATIRLTGDLNPEDLPPEVLEGLIAIRR